MDLEIKIFLTSLIFFLISVRIIATHESDDFNLPMLILVLVTCAASIVGCIGATLYRIWA